MVQHFDAIVVGAGPAGSATAILLARAGWAVALIEKQRFPRRKVCGECIAASNLPLLDALGIGDAVEAGAGAPLRQVSLLRGEASVTAELPAAGHPRHPWGRALGRETLDTLLLEQARAAGVAVMQPWAVQTLCGRAGAWQCELRSAESAARRPLQASVLIDAHGSWEGLPWERAVRRRARGGADLLAFKANFLDSSLRDGVISVMALDGGYGGMVIGDRAVTTLACCIRRDRLGALRRAAPGTDVGGVVEAWLRGQCSGVRDALRHARRDGPWLSSGPLDPRLRIGADDGIFRVGNAAGEAHPILGEGMSMALQSAALLAVQLLGNRPAGAVPAGDLQAELQRRYANEWRREFLPRMRLAAGFAQLAMRPRCAAAFFALAGAWPGILTRGARWGGKVRLPGSMALPLRGA